MSGTRSPHGPLWLLPLPPLLLLLSLGLQDRVVRGDCGQPPQVPNAQPDLNGRTHFPEQSFVTYICNEGFLKIPGKTDTVTCLAGGQWSEIKEFCGRSCNVPTRLVFASLKKEYITMSFYPVGFTVEYMCRPGFQRNPVLSPKSTCLQNLEWSKVDTFCNKKSCPNPGDIRNGNINITTDILFGSQIFFSCNIGYRLVGVDSAFCSVSGKTVVWSDPFPVCTDPPKIANGIIEEEKASYVYGQTITYECAKGFILVGKSSIYCTVKNDLGEWSDAPPECKGKSLTSKVPPTVRKPTTVSFPDTKVPSTSKPTAINVPSTEVSLVSQKPATINVPGTKVSSTSQKPATINVPGTKVSSTSQKPTVGNVSGTKVPRTSQRSSTVNVPGTRIPPKPQKPTKVNIPTTEVPPTPQKPTKVNIPATELPPTPQKPNTVNLPATEVPPPQKPTKINIPTTEVPPTPQKPTKVNIPTTEVPPTPQKPTKVNIPATEVPPTPQKPNTVNLPATEVPPPQKPTKVNILATELPPTPQKPNPVNLPVTELPPTPQKPTKVNIPATELPPTPQKPTKVKIPATEVPPTPQKLITAKAPATKTSTTALTSPTSDGLPAKTPPMTQNPTMANTSVLQTTQATHKFTTTKTLFTHNLSATQKSVTSRVSLTKGRFTSAHIAATQQAPATRTTMNFHSTRTSTKRKEISTSDAESLLYGFLDDDTVTDIPLLVSFYGTMENQGHTCIITLTVLLVMLVIIG